MRAGSLPNGPGDSAEQTWGAEGVGKLKQCPHVADFPQTLEQ